MVPGFSIRDIRMLMLQLWQHCTSEEQWDLRWCSTSTHSSCLNIASLWCLIIYHKILFLNQCVGTATAYVAQNYIFHYYWYHINLETIFNIIVMTNLFFSHCLKWLHNSLLFPCWLNFLFLKLLLWWFDAYFGLCCFGCFFVLINIFLANLWNICQTLDR